MAVALMVAGCAAAQVASQRTVVDHIKKLEADRIQAGVRKDVAWVAAATADEYVQVDWEGKVLDKAAMLARIGSSNIRLQSNTLDEIDVKVYGDVAVVTGRATRKGVMDAKDISTSVRYTRVYVKREGRWQVVQFQQTSAHGPIHGRLPVRRRPNCSVGTPVPGRPLSLSRLPQASWGAFSRFRDLSSGCGDDRWRNP